jgi:hypothetical protein
MTEHSKAPQFVETGLNSIITEVALALVGVKDGHWAPLGTCIVISGNMAVTAKHVIQYYFSQYEGISVFRGSLTGTGAIYARQILNEGKTGRLWSVRKAWLSPITDVAYLYLAPRSEEALSYKWKACNMKVTPPAIGSRVAGFGYHSSRIFLRQNESVLNVKWDDSPTTTVGEVVEIYPARRDGSMLIFPCYRVNARFESGMSGGPIFNDDGHLCGLVCASLDGDPQGPYISYVVSLWPSLGTFVQVQFAENPSGSPMRIYELAKLGRIPIVDLDKVSLGKNDSGDSTIECTH